MIDGATNTVIDTIAVGTDPIGVGVNSSSNKIYVTSEANNTVTVIDGSTDSVIDTIAVGTGPRFVGILY